MVISDLILKIFDSVSINKLEEPNFRHFKDFEKKAGATKI